MTMRTTRTSITFAHPFYLDGFDKAFPAGEYSVDTDEETLPDVSFPAYRRVATMIQRVTPGSPQPIASIATVDPHELAAALFSDRTAAPATALDLLPKMPAYGYFSDRDGGG